MNVCTERTKLTLSGQSLLATDVLYDPYDVSLLERKVGINTYEERCMDAEVTKVIRDLEEYILGPWDCTLMSILKKRGWYFFSSVMNMLLERVGSRTMRSHLSVTQFIGDISRLKETINYAMTVGTTSFSEFSDEKMGRHVICNTDALQVVELALGELAHGAISTFQFIAVVKCVFSQRMYYGFHRFEIPDASSGYICSRSLKAMDRVLTLMRKYKSKFQSEFYCVIGIMHVHFVWLKDTDGFAIFSGRKSLKRSHNSTNSSISDDCVVESPPQKRRKVIDDYHMTVNNSFTVEPDVYFTDSLPSDDVSINEENAVSLELEMRDGSYI
jgi:hypothetical protein